MNPLPFGITRHNQDETPMKYGRNSYCIGLPDGREFTVTCERVTVEHGSLLVWGAYRGQDWENPDSAPEQSDVLLTLPTGGWSHCYAASVIDGSPIIVWELAKPEES